jgi:hypothetical protein
MTTMPQLRMSRTSTVPTDLRFRSERAADARRAVRAAAASAGLAALAAAIGVLADGVVVAAVDGVLVVLADPRAAAAETASLS